MREGSTCWDGELRERLKLLSERSLTVMAVLIVTVCFVWW